MSRIHAFLVASALGAAASAAIPAIAQMSHAHGAMAMAMPTAADAPSATGAGEVRKIDVENTKVTLKHDAMKEVGMPAMTMVYAVADASVLRNIKVGEKVRFRATTAGGKTTITEMQPAQ